MQWKLKRRWLANQLKHAPKPLAILAATDDHAVEVLETCESIRLTVPEQVSIIGVDNSAPMLDLFRQRLASTPFEDRITLQCENIGRIAIENASVVVLNFTLQFLPPDERDDLVLGIHE